MHLQHLGESLAHRKRSLMVPLPQRARAGMRRHSPGLRHGNQLGPGLPGSTQSVPGVAMPGSLFQRAASGQTTDRG